MPPFLVTVRHPCCGWKLKIVARTVGFNVARHRAICPLWGKRG